MGHATFDHIQVRSGTPHENAEGVLNETSRWDVEIDGLEFHVSVLELADQCALSAYSTSPPTVVFLQERKRACPRGQSPTCWSSPKIRIRYQTVCLLHRGYRVDGAFLPKCSGPGSSPPGPLCTRYLQHRVRGRRQCHRCAGAAAALPSRHIAVKDRFRHA
jgi:hypothetical protein